MIDELGDLEAAIQLARKRAGIAPEKKVRVVTYVKRPSTQGASPHRTSMGDVGQRGFVLGRTVAGPRRSTGSAGERGSFVLDAVDPANQVAVGRTRKI